MVDKNDEKPPSKEVVKAGEDFFTMVKAVENAKPVDGQKT